MRLILPTSIDELQRKSKATASFVIEKDYVLSYRDIARLHAQCFNYSAGNDYRTSSTTLNRDEKWGEIVGKAPFDTIVSFVSVEEIAPTKTAIKVWSTIHNYDLVIRKWAGGDLTCGFSPS